MFLTSESKEMKLLLVFVILTKGASYGGGLVAAEPSCNDVHNFIKHYNELLKHLPDYTYPVFSMCTNKTAEEAYGNALFFYQNMTKNPECQKYLGRNHMTVFEKLYGEMTELWSTANCDACINAPNVTAEFMNLSDTLSTCLEVNPTNPCASCDADYQRVQQFYGRMRNPDRLCFDIEDRMNQTRRAWSGIYNCCKDKKYSTVAFFSIASVACAMPVAFYVVMHALRLRSDNRSMLLSATSVEDEPCHSSATLSTASVSQPPIHQGQPGIVQRGNENESDEDPIIDHTRDLEKIIDFEQGPSNQSHLPKKAIKNRDLLNSDLDDEY